MPADKNAIIALLAMNSKMTAEEAADAHELLGAILLLAVQQTGGVHIPGAGTIEVDKDGQVVFTPSDDLKAVIADKGKKIKLQTKHGFTNKELASLGDWAYVHQVNVC